MFKKICAVIAAAALMVTGFAVSPASATTPADVALIDMGESGWNATLTKTGNSFPVPTGQNSAFQNNFVTLNSSWISAHQGSTIRAEFIAKDKDGVDIPDWNLTGADDINSLNWLNASISTMDNKSYYWNSSSWGMYIQSPSAGYSNVFGSSFTVPADGGNINRIYFQLSQSVFKGNFFDSSSVIPAGTYTLGVRLLVDNVEIAPSDAGVSMNLSTAATVNAHSLSTTVPSGRTNTQASTFHGVVCVDPTKVAVGDTVKAEYFIDGASVNSDVLNGNRSKGMLSPMTMDLNKMFDPAARSMIDQTDTAVVTQFDKDWGLAFSLFWNDRTYTWADGSNHSAAVKLYNTATNIDVSGNCAPGKTGAPTYTVDADGNYVVSVTPAIKSNVTYCILYDKSASRKIVAYSMASGNPQSNQPAQCIFDKSILVSGHDYEFDTVSGYYNNYGFAQGVTTDGSAPKLNGAGGAKIGGGAGSTVQTITFNAPELSKAWVGSTNLTVAASASSALSLTYTSSTPSICTVDSVTGVVTAVAAGDCTITAGNSGNVTYAANSKTVTFAIAASQPTGSTVQTITFTAPTSATAYVGSEAINLGVTSSSGIQVSYASSTTGVCTVEPQSGHVTALATGNCTITASVAGDATYAANSKTVTFAIGAAAAGTTEQTFSLSVPAQPTAGLEGFDLSGTSTSGLAIVYTSRTADVCTVDPTGHVNTLKAGTCTISATQAGNATYAPKTQNVTFTIAAESSAAVTESDNPASPSVLPKTGAWVQSRETFVSWNRTKALLGMKIKVLYIGPIKATATFKVGTKSYSCVVNFGLLKKQTTSKLMTLTAPTFCLGKTEKAQLALLKKIKSGTVVTIVVNREWHHPTTYAKIRLWKRTMYVKLS